jgi:hypothetical protein
VDGRTDFEKPQKLNNPPQHEEHGHTNSANDREDSAKLDERDHQDRRASDNQQDRDDNSIPIRFSKHLLRLTFTRAP